MKKTVKKKVSKKKTVKKTESTTTVSHCNFTGVHWDATSVDAVSQIAEGLTQNAIALGSLAELMKSQHVTIGPMIQMNSK